MVTCKVCGYRGEQGEIGRYYIIPREVLREAGEPAGRKIALCDSCHKEFLELCAKVIADMTYDTASRRFRAKSPPEIVKEYEAAYRRFVRYKKEKQGIA